MIHFCCLFSLTGGVLSITPGSQFYDMSGSHLLYLVDSWMLRLLLPLKLMVLFWNHLAIWLPEGPGEDLVPLSSRLLFIGLRDLSLNLSSFSESWTFFSFFWWSFCRKSIEDEEVLVTLSFFFVTNFLDAIASLQFSMSVGWSVGGTLLTWCPVTVTFNF